MQSYTNRWTDTDRRTGRETDCNTDPEQKAR